MADQSIQPEEESVNDELRENVEAVEPSAESPAQELFAQVESDEPGQGEQAQVEPTQDQQGQAEQTELQTEHAQDEAIQDDQVQGEPTPTDQFGTQDNEMPTEQQQSIPLATDVTEPDTLHTPARSPTPTAPLPFSPEPSQQDTQFVPPTARTLQSPPPSTPTYTFQNTDPATLDAPITLTTPLSRVGSGATTPVEVGYIPPTTPTQEESVQEEQQAVPEPIPQGLDREELVAKIRAELDGKDKLRIRNVALQNRLGEYFRKKRTDETRETDPKPPTDLTTRYTTSLSTLLTLNQTLQALHQTHTKLSTDYLTKLTQKQEEAAAKAAEFSTYKRAIAQAAENSRTGRKIAPKVLEGLEINEERKEAEVIEVRLENIKLRNRLRRSEGLLRQKEELADGLHLIDFEQLKIENATYNEKIEDRNEDLLKLRKKITTIVQVLTHVKEKLHHLSHETRVLQDTLGGLDEQVMRKRDELPVKKGERDKLRNENAELRKRAGLLGSVGLLRDFEKHADEAQALHGQINALRTRHADLSAEMLGVKRKIQKAQIVGAI
ncbi:hypothetical protein SpCBS45565_g08005 [Spizellomyces sp. 'palustris']|nr:hypothetical protein SpCBS45565_g08005 [Spizellomyces sp. 'palustris']